MSKLGRGESKGMHRIAYWAVGEEGVRVCLDIYFGSGNVHEQ